MFLWAKVTKLTESCENILRKMSFAKNFEFFLRKMATLLKFTEKIESHTEKIESFTERFDNFAEKIDTCTEKIKSFAEKIYTFLTKNCFANLTIKSINAEICLEKSPYEAKKVHFGNI